MKFSIIIPVYNLENYIIRCLDSFSRQNLPVENFELIIVNDGSTDKSVGKIEDFQKLHPDLHINLFSKTNGGLSSARNFGMSKASGDYIWFVDGDDWVSDDALQSLSEYLELYPILEILEFDYKLAIAAESGFQFKYAGNPEAKSENVESGRHFLENHEYSLGVTVKIYKRNFLERTKEKFVLGRYSEDNLFSLNTTLLAESYLKINEVYYFYYQRQNSISKTKTTQHLKKYYEDIVYNLMEMRLVTKSESAAVINTITRMSSFFVLLMMYDLFVHRKFNLIIIFAKKLKREGFFPLVNINMSYINVKKFNFFRKLANVFVKFI